jgi:hypothetical protein
LQENGYNLTSSSYVEEASLQRQVAHFFSHMWNLVWFKKGCERKMGYTKGIKEKRGREWGTRNNKEGEHDQSALFACMEMS